MAKFTNRPELAGDPEWTYIGDKPPDDGTPAEGWSLGSIVRSFPSAFNIDPEAADAIDRGEKTKLGHAEDIAGSAGMSLKEYLTSDYGVQAARYGRPPKDWNTPDYSQEGRDRYEQIVFSQIGGNPYKFDPAEEVNKASSRLPTLFHDIFEGQIRYEDRHTMNKKQRDHWDRERNRFRAYVENDAKARKNKMTEEYEWMMGKFDSRAKAFRTAMDKIEERTNETFDVFNRKLDARNVKMTRKQFEKARAEDPGWTIGDPMAPVKNETFDVFNEKRGVKNVKMTRKQFEKARAEDPGWTIGHPMAPVKEEDGESVLDIQRIFNMEKQALNEDNLVDGRIDPVLLNEINRAREALGWPLLEEIVGEKPAWGPWGRWWNENMPGFLGGGDPEPPPVKTDEFDLREVEGGTKQTDTGTSAQPTAVDASGNPYPEGHTGTYQGKPVVVQNGQWVFQ